MTPDVNVLVAASRSDHAHHAVAFAWLESARDDAPRGRGLLLLPMVLASFLRLVTNPRVFKSPTPPPAAIAFLDALIASPGVRMPAVGGEWPLLRELCLRHRLSGNELPDAWIAAAVQQFGDHLVSFDADFRKLLTRTELTLLRP